jgi:hypothetical protein
MIGRLLTYLILLIAAAGCTNDSNNIKGYWSFTYGEEIEQNGVAQIDSSHLMWYHDGIGYVPGTYFIKADSFYCFDIIDKDTVISFSNLLKFKGDNHFEMINKNGVGNYERITEKELNEFIDERESRIVQGEEDNIIPIKENTSRHYMPDNSEIKNFKFSKDMLFNYWAHSDDGVFAFRINKTGFYIGAIGELSSIPYLIQNDTIEVFEYHGGPNGMETSKGVITKLTNDSLVISFFTGGSSIGRYVKFKTSD